MVEKQPLQTFMIEVAVRGRKGPVTSKDITTAVRRAVEMQNMALNEPFIWAGYRAMAVSDFSPASDEDVEQENERQEGAAPEPPAAPAQEA